MEKDHMGILLEEMNSKFELVLEGHSSLRKEIRDAREESNEKHEVTGLLLKALDDKVESTAKRLDDKVESTAKRLDDKISSVRDELVVEIRAVGEKVEDHEARIRKLELK